MTDVPRTDPLAPMQPTPESGRTQETVGSGSDANKLTGGGLEGSEELRDIGGPNGPSPKPMSTDRD